ncbi:MAG: hypothetical protein K2X81_23040 [Candidatus Obscuribacterales bacterium]|nr:hypothetical protein [Candidatus Obscuribacterales bacterium]
MPKVEKRDYDRALIAISQANRLLVVEGDGSWQFDNEKDRETLNELIRAYASQEAVGAKLILEAKIAASRILEGRPDRRQSKTR